VRFQRLLREDGSLEYRVVEEIGENPIGNQDPHALCTLAEEKEAARLSGFDPEDPTRRFIAPEHQSYPFAYERVAQLFDSPNAPDLAITPRDWCQGIQYGTHGGLQVRQSRAPLWLKGPGVRSGRHELAARAVDIAPTCLAALGFPPIDAADASGRTSSERGVAADVLLARQDGRVLEEILDPDANPPKRLYLFLLDGIHSTELEDRLERDPEAIPNLRRLREGAAVLASGSIVNFPSITWPSHTAIATGAWCGHHDVVNLTYYLREKREVVSPQGQLTYTEGFASPAVEGLYEAFQRVKGEETLTAAIHAPFGRGADHAVFEGRNLGDRARLKALNQELASDRNPRWRADQQAMVERESVGDGRGMAQVIELFTRDDLPAPSLVYHELFVTDGAGHDYGPHHEGLRQALDESDRRVGRVLDLLEKLGLADETLFVVTADHAMAPQDVSLRANPARHVERIGMAVKVAEPMIWLQDLAVTVERAGDGRTGRVIVTECDALASGERPALEGAEVVVELHEGEAARARELVRGRTGAGGVFGFSTPSEIPSERIALLVRHPDFNPRRIRLDGKRLAIDLRAALYGT